jgi:hypothetical protein
LRGKSRRCGEDGRRREEAFVIDVNIGADKNPGGAGVWELPGLGVSQPAFGGSYRRGEEAPESVPSPIQRHAGRRQ